MKTRSTHNDLAQIGKLAVAAGRGLHSSAYGDQAEATRRQKKHDLLVTFMANARTEKRRPAPAKPRLLSALLSLFF